MLAAKDIADKYSLPKLSAQELDILAKTTIKDIENKLQIILDRGESMLTRLAKLKENKLTNKLSPQEQYKMRKIEEDAEEISNMIFLLQEAWKEKITILAGTDKVAILHPWTNEIEDILKTEKGRYCINFLAVEFLKKLISDDEIRIVFQERLELIQKTIEQINKLETQTRIILEIDKSRIGVNFQELLNEFYSTQRYDQNSILQPSPGQKINYQR